MEKRLGGIKPESWVVSAGRASEAGGSAECAADPGVELHNRGRQRSLDRSRLGNKLCYTVTLSTCVVDLIQELLSAGGGFFVLG